MLFPQANKRTQARKGNSQSEIVYVYEAKMNKGSTSEQQRTNRHSGVEQEHN